MLELELARRLCPPEPELGCRGCRTPGNTPHSAHQTGKSAETATPAHCSLQRILLILAWENAGRQHRQLRSFEFHAVFHF